MADELPVLSPEEWLSMHPAENVVRDERGVEHCSNYDPDFPGCRACRGRIVVVLAGGGKDIICRAGESRVQ